MARVVSDLDAALSEKSSQIDELTRQLADAKRALEAQPAVPSEAKPPMKTLVDPAAINAGQIIRWESAPDSQLVSQYVAAHDGHQRRLRGDGQYYE